MSNANANKTPTTSAEKLNAAAATAATAQPKSSTNGASAPAGNGASAPTPVVVGSSTGTTEGTPPTEDESDPLMYFIVTGQTHSFKTVAKAEKFLNEPGAPVEYTVIRGRAAPAKKRVSLRG